MQLAHDNKPTHEYQATASYIERLQYILSAMYTNATLSTSRATVSRLELIIKK